MRTKCPDRGHIALRSCPRRAGKRPPDILPLPVLPLASGSVDRPSGKMAPPRFRQQPEARSQSLRWRRHRSSFASSASSRSCPRSDLAESAHGAMRGHPAPKQVSVATPIEFAAQLCTGILVAQHIHAEHRLPAHVPSDGVAETVPTEEPCFRIEMIMPRRAAQDDRGGRQGTPGYQAASCRQQGGIIRDFSR